MSVTELISLLGDPTPEGASRSLFVVKTRTGKEILGCRADIRLMASRLKTLGKRARLDLDVRAWIDTVEGATLLHRHIKVVSDDPLRWEPISPPPTMVGTETPSR